jgi:hypothetical protein
MPIPTSTHPAAAPVIGDRFQTSSDLVKVDLGATLRVDLQTAVLVSPDVLAAPAAGSISSRDLLRTK